MRLLLLVLLALNAHAGGSRRAPIAAPSPAPAAEIGHGELPAPPAPAREDRVRFEPVHEYATAAESMRIRAAGHLMNQVVQGECFRNFMANRALRQTGGRSAAEVADYLRSLTGTIPVRMYKRTLTSAIAYRQPPGLTIHLNRKAFHEATPLCRWAGTMGHESLGHSIGNFEHDTNWNLERSFSVPYSIDGADTKQGGDAFDECCKEAA